MSKAKLVRLLTSNIGRKILMGASGLLLLAFLVVHVSGNLILFAGREPFNEYSHKLISNPLIYVAEIGLLVLFAAHFASGILVTLSNRAARPVGYVVKRGAGGVSHKSLASTSMILSGLLLLAFVPLHLWTFKYGPQYSSPVDPAVRDLHRLVLEEFHEPLEVMWYVGAMLVIGLHLWHGFGSGFESLGVTHWPALRHLGQALAVVITVGFLIVPIAVYFWMAPS